MNFKTENEFCRETTKLLLGLSVGSGRSVIAIPEVPWGYYSNEQFDMLLLDVKNLEYMPIEYKLSDLAGLRKQRSRLVGSVGIINAKVPPKSWGIYPYTGEDAEIDQLDKVLFGEFSTWRSVYCRFGLIYYWAYKNNESDLNGGTTGGGRDNFATVYMQAIRSLHKHYGKLDFMLTHAALSSGYSVSVSKKYYNQAIKQG